MSTEGAFRNHLKVGHDTFQSSLCGDITAFDENNDLMFFKGFIKLFFNISVIPNRVYFIYCHQVRFRFLFLFNKIDKCLIKYCFITRAISITSVTETCASFY